MPIITGCEKVYDCIMRVRCKYRMASPVTEAMLERFAADPTVAVEVYDASRFLPRSRLVFHIRHRSEDFLIVGALGLDYVTVTYSKGDGLTDTMARLEEALACLP